MKAFWFFGAVVAFFVLIWAVDVYRHRHPLNKLEILALSRKRQRNQALWKFNFSTRPQPAEAVEKKAMKSLGEFVGCDLGYHDVPARIAGLLKYKKHEWIVIAFINSFHVRHLWWNKGPDGTSVWPFLRGHSMKAAIRTLRPDSIAILHNHPNPDPSRYRTNIPSEADIRAACFHDNEFSKHGISLLEFICERGGPHLYYASFSDSVVPVEPIIDEIQEINGTGIFKNYSLRKELKQTTKAEQVAGGSNDQAAVPQL
jgi:hypothetical protein